MIYLVPLFLCWGSFLNFLAYRLVHNISFSTMRSICTSCKHILAWYDLIPVFSWITLKGKCRYCKDSISWLYPAIELLTTVAMYGLLVFTNHDYFLAYFIFFSALIVTIRTDIETMLVSRFVTLFLIPIAILFSLTFFHSYTLLPLSTLDCVKGTIFGYTILYLLNSVFFFFTKKRGMGEGDMEILALIGAFTGIYGCWISLMLASILGSTIGIFLILFQGRKLSAKIPFGPFLAISAMLYLLFQDQILTMIFC